MSVSDRAVRLLATLAAYVAVVFGLLWWAKQQPGMLPAALLLVSFCVAAALCGSHTLHLCMHALSGRARATSPLVAMIVSLSGVVLMLALLGGIMGGTSMLVHRP